MGHGPEENESSGCDGFASLVRAALETGGFWCNYEVATVGWCGGGGLRVERAEAAKAKISLESVVLVGSQNTTVHVGVHTIDFLLLLHVDTLM